MDMYDSFVSFHKHSKLKQKQKKNETNKLLQIIIRVVYL